MESEFPAIFQHIRELYEPYARAGVVLHDEPGRYSLGTHNVRPKDGYRLWFGSLEIKKNYVSAHVMPVYVHPELLATISPALRKRMQGKACFNFKVKDDGLLAELGRLIALGAETFVRDGSLRPPLPPDPHEGKHPSCDGRWRGVVWYHRQIADHREAAKRAAEKSAIGD